ncbi:MAG: YfdX family protein [Epsilonproteobacteria bacterium]|nr:YfdX family protein [Campylobacterota bacterium]
MKKILSSIVVAGLLATSSFAADKKTENVKHNAVVKAEQNANVALIKEAVKALKYTQDAYIYLNDKKVSKAKDSLKKAIGELAIVLNAPNAPYLLPVNVDISATEYVGNIANIKKQVSLAKDALDKNQLPIARTILNNLKSEIDISTLNIPLATYPQAIQLAIKYLNQNKINEAKDIIAMAIHTLVTTDTIIPIPIVKANELVKAASAIAHKNKKQALKYLAEAKKQLELAQALGYTSTSDTTYKMLTDAISTIQSKLTHNKNTDSLFEQLKNKLKEFKDKAVSIISK